MDRDKQLHDEAYALISKPGRTAQEENRLKQLMLEINRDQGFQRDQTSKTTPTLEQKSAKINEFLTALDDKPSDRYNNRQPYKKINSRYGSEEIS
jgi:hypothetical protein